MAFTSPLRWAVHENSSSTLIAEMSLVWDDSPQGNVVTTVQSPDLRTLYGLPTDAVAVRLFLKTKVLCKTWSPYLCDGTIGVGVHRLAATEPANFNVHVRMTKAANQAGLTPERVTYVPVDVQLVDGRFEVNYDVTIVNHCLVSSDIFLAGYGVP